MLERCADDARVACMQVRTYNTDSSAHRHTVCRSDLAPDYADLGATDGLVCAVHIGDPLAQVPVRVLGVADALKSEQAHVGVGVALAALVADVSGLDVDCCN